MSEHSVGKHIVPPATAAQIGQAVGVTDEDRKAVAKVLRVLGYLPDEKDRATARKAAESARRPVRRLPS